MGRTNSLHPTTQIYTIQITLVINLESTDHQFGVSDYQHSLDILVFNQKYIPPYFSLWMSKLGVWV